MDRKSPFDLTGFEPRQPATTERRPSAEEVERIASETGFPSRAPAAKGRAAPKKTEGAQAVSEPGDNERHARTLGGGETVLAGPSRPAARPTPAPAPAPASVAPIGQGNPADILRRDNRRRTGRSIQKNFKLDAETIAALDEEASRGGMTFGQVLERGIAAIRKLRELKIEDY